jgi:hypothetical protein
VPIRPDRASKDGGDLDLARKSRPSAEISEIFRFFFRAVAAEIGPVVLGRKLAGRAAQRHLHKPTQDDHDRIE